MTVNEIVLCKPRGTQSPLCRLILTCKYMHCAATLKRWCMTNWISAVTMSHLQSVGVSVVLHWQGLFVCGRLCIWCVLYIDLCLLVCCSYIIYLYIFFFPTVKIASYQDVVWQYSCQEASTIFNLGKDMSFLSFLPTIGKL